MICENTISAGFFFMMGKFLFDTVLFCGVILLVVLFFSVILWLANRKSRS